MKIMRSWRWANLFAWTLLTGGLTAQTQSHDIVGLIESCKYNAVPCTPESVTSLIKAGADPNATNEVGLPVLQVAVANQLSRDTISALLAAGADVNGTDRFGGTALMVMMDQERPEVLQLLLRRGADPNARNKDGWTVLMFAAYEGVSVIAVKSLLTAGADARAKIPAFVESNRPEAWAAGDTALDVAVKRLHQFQREPVASNSVLRAAQTAVIHRAEEIVALLR